MTLCVSRGHDCSDEIDDPWMKDLLTTVKIFASSLIAELPRTILKHVGTTCIHVPGRIVSYIRI